MNPTVGGYDSRGPNEDEGEEEALNGAEEGTSLADELGDDMSDHEASNDGRLEDTAAQGLQNDTQPDEVDLPDHDLHTTGDEPDVGPRTPPPTSPAPSSSIPDDTPSLPGSLASLPLREACLLYTSPSPRDRTRSRMPSSA